MERPRRPRVEAIVLYHASVARLKKIQGMFGIIRHNSGPGGICKLIFAVLESQNTVFFTPYHWFSPILSSQNHHTTPYRKVLYSTPPFQNSQALRRKVEIHLKYTSHHSPYVCNPHIIPHDTTKSKMSMIRPYVFHAFSGETRPWCLEYDALDFSTSLELFSLSLLL